MTKLRAALCDTQPPHPSCGLRTTSIRGGKRGIYMSICNIKLKSVFLNDINDVTIVLPDPPMRSGETARQYYSRTEKFKVLWLLHGGRDTLRDWGAYSNVPRLALKYGIILVMPNGHDSDFVNHPESGDGYMFQDYFFEELMPLIYHWLPASQDPADNYLAGNSMGCAAAWQYGISHPECFSWIAPLSNQPLDYRYLEPYRNMKSGDFREYVNLHADEIPAAYGAVGEHLHVKEINAICKYASVGDFLDSPENTMQRFEEAAAAKRLPHVWLPCGNLPRDNKLKEFREFCQKQGIPNMHFENYTEDTHSFAFWEKSIDSFIRYLQIPEVDYFIGC